MNKNYDDIIHLPHHTSTTHPRMPMQDRAAQFAPFAALTGHSAAINETARLTDKKISLSEEESAQLNETLLFLLKTRPNSPEAQVTHFVPDPNKDGGAYVKTKGYVQRLDTYARMLIMDNDTGICIDDIIDIEIPGNSD